MNNILFFYILKCFDTIFRKFGYTIRYGKLLKMSSKKKEDVDLVVLDENRLEKYYDISFRPKDIFNDIQ